MADDNTRYAFPSDLSRGLSALDYFAAEAMKGFLSCAAQSVASDAASNPYKCAEWAYEQAEAMMDERKRHTHN